MCRGVVTSGSKGSTRTAGESHRNEAMQPPYDSAMCKTEYKRENTDQGKEIIQDTKKKKGHIPT
jgi:hypothetical protein